MSDQEIRHPQIQVQLVGTDGNAMMIIGAVTRALRRGGIDQAEIGQFVEEATSGDYDNVLATAMRWVQVS